MVSCERLNGFDVATGDPEFAVYRDVGHRPFRNRFLAEIERQPQTQKAGARCAPSLRWIGNLPLAAWVA